MADKIESPMLAGKLENLSDLKYPVLCTPKLDGIRALKIDGKLVSRNFKPIPNTYIREQIEKYFPDGVDGELILEGGTFQDTTSAVMRDDGEPPIVYYVFDYISGDLSKPYQERMKDLFEFGKSLGDNIAGLPIHLVLPVEIKNEKELLQYEKAWLTNGYEGVMLRSPHGPYKCGRSTVREGYLLKLKRFEDTEAVIVRVEERMHNANAATKDAFGRTERSSHKANMEATGTLGAFIVKSAAFEKEFNVGTGLTEKQRVEWWLIRDSLIGKTIKIKYQPTGVKDAPRFPVLLGFRDTRDMG
jgi:DNA ligase-1